MPPRTAVRNRLLGIVAAVVASSAFPALVWAQEQTEKKKDPSIFDAFDEFFSTMQARLPFFLAAVVIIILSFVVAKFAAMLAERALRRSTVHRTAFTIFTKTAYVGALTIGFTIALKVAGLDISFVVAAATFGLGFAMKDLLENYISGVIIVLQEPFHVGDMVEVSGNLGWVEEIEARVTFVRSIEGQRVIIPNSMMISSALKNYSAYPQRRLALKVGVSYDTDMQQVLGLLKKVLDEDDEVLKTPAPLVLFQEFGDSALMLEARFWIDQTVSHWLKVPSKLSVKVKRALDAANINIPFPITTLNVNPHDSGDLLQALNPALAAAQTARQQAEATERAAAVALDKAAS